MNCKKVQRLLAQVDHENDGFLSAEKLCCLWLSEKSLFAFYKELQDIFEVICVLYWNYKIISLFLSTIT